MRPSLRRRHLRRNKYAGSHVAGYFVAADFFNADAGQSPVVADGQQRVEVQGDRIMR